MPLTKFVSLCLNSLISYEAIRTERNGLEGWRNLDRGRDILLKEGKGEKETIKVKRDAEILVYMNVITGK